MLLWSKPKVLVHVWKIIIFIYTNNLRCTIFFFPPQIKEYLNIVKFSIQTKQRHFKCLSKCQGPRCPGITFWITHGTSQFQVILWSSWSGGGNLICSSPSVVRSNLNTVLPSQWKLNQSYQVEQHQLEGAENANSRKITSFMAKVLSLI